MIERKTLNNAASAFNRLPLRYRVGAVIAAVASIGLGVRSCEPTDDMFKHRLLTPEETIDYCEESELDISFRGSDGREAYGVINAPTDDIEKIKKQYYPGTEAGVAFESIVAANTDQPADDGRTRVAIAEFGHTTLPAHQSLGSLSTATGFDESSLACVNGLAPESRFPDDRAVRIPRQIATPEGHKTVVVVAGDTYSAIAQDNNIDPGQITPDALQAKNLVPPEKLQPGDILFIRNEQVLGGDEKLRTFIEKYKSYAQMVEEEFGFPWEAVLAQAVVETGYGESVLAKEAYNFHGLKFNDEGYVKGEPFPNITSEEVAGSELADFAGRIISKKKLDNGKWLIKIRGENFQQFSNTQDGFRGYGRHIENRLDGDAYADARGVEDPYEYFAKLVDKTGSKYATDSEYKKKVNKFIDEIIQLDRPIPPKDPGEDVDLRALWNAYDPNEKYMTTRADECDNPATGEDLIKLSEFERFVQSYENLANVKLSREGYEKFVADGIKDATADVKEVNPRAFNHPDFNNLPGLKDVDSVRELVSHFLIHFTANPQSADKYDGKKFASAMANGNRGSLVQFLINRKEDNSSQTYFLTPHFTYQLRDLSSQVMGVELAGCTQAALQPAQLENAEYLSAMFLIKYGYVQPNESITSIVNQTIKGSYEPVIGRTDVHSDGVPIIMDQFRAKLIDFMVDELDYKR